MPLVLQPTAEVTQAAVVCELRSRGLNLKVSELSSKRRSTSVALPRQLAMFLGYIDSAHGYTELARVFGKDLSTLSHDIAQVRVMLRSHTVFQECLVSELLMASRRRYSSILKLQELTLSHKFKTWAHIVDPKTTIQKVFNALYYCRCLGLTFPRGPAQRIQSAEMLIELAEIGKPRSDKKFVL